MAEYEPYKMRYRTIPSTGDPRVDYMLAILLSSRDNESCFDCGKENPTMASLALGVWICDGCADIHADFKSPFNNVRPIFFPDWPAPKFTRMSVGGNYNARVFFEKLGWTGGGDLEAKYTSEVAKLYRKTLSAKVLNYYHNDIPEGGLANPSGSDIRAFIAWSKAYDSKSRAKVSKTKVPKETDEARKRFANAKSISSAQFFGDLEKISSAQFFGDQEIMDDTKSKLCLHKSKSMNPTSIFSADLFGLTSGQPSKIIV